MGGWNGSGQVIRDNGTYTGTQVWQNDRDAKSKVRADLHDTHDNVLADAIENCVARDGQNSPSADLPMNSHKHTGVADGTARTHYASVGQVQDGLPSWVAAGGTADALTAAYSPAVAAVADGMLLRCKAGAANATTTPTFSPNGLTARTIKKFGGQALVAGDIYGAGHELFLVYHATGTYWELLNPALGLLALPLAGGTLSGTVNFADNVCQRPELKDWAETANAASSSSNAITLDYSTGNVFTTTLTENITTITLSNWPASGKHGKITWDITQAATAKTITFPAAVKWGDSGAPDLTTVSKVYTIILRTTDGGTTVYGYLAGRAF